MLDFLLPEFHTSLRQPHTAVVAIKAIAVINMEVLVQLAVTGIGILMETRLTMKKKKLKNTFLQNQDMGSQVTNKKAPSRRVHVL